MKTIQLVVPQILSVIMLGFAMSHMPYGYYMVLRWVICGITSFLAVKSKFKGELVWAWVFGIQAVIYNPFFPLYFGREIWSYVNVLSIGIFSINSLWNVQTIVHGLIKKKRRVYRILTCSGDPYLSEGLQKMAQITLGDGCIVEVVDSHDSAKIIELLGQQSFDVIIPLLNNITVRHTGNEPVEDRVLEVVVLLKRLKERTRIPIIALSGFKPSFDLPALIKKCGIDAFLWTPFDSKELASPLRQCLKLAPAEGL